MLEKIIDSCRDLSIDWLITGSGDMLRGVTVEQNGKELPPGECVKCKEKEETIAELKEQLISTQSEYIELLKEQSPQNSGQKRKAS